MRMLIRNQQNIFAFDLRCILQYNNLIMQKKGAEPDRSPELIFEDEECLPLIQNLSLQDKTFSGISQKSNANQGSMHGRKTKLIGRDSGLRRRYNKETAKPEGSYQKKVQKLEEEIESLKEELALAKRKIQSCESCRRKQPDMFSAYMPNYEEQMRRVAGNFEEKRLSRGSHGSLQFQNVDFHAPVLFSKEMDDRAWIYLGAVMIAMGSKCIDFDGTLNVFKILKESVDSLRRQVDKSEQNISLDFFISQEDMGAEQQQNLYMQEIGYDPFTQKLKNSQGLCLEGVKIESVEQFDLIYDSKLTFNLKYEALLGAVQYLRENSWVTF